MHLHRLPLAVGVVASMLVPAAPAVARDRDHDGMSDRWERKHHVRAASRDHDHDGLSNRAEYLSATNPRRKDSDRDGRRDGREDHDRDRLANAVEVATANNPGLRDSDDDGILDTAEGAGRVVAVEGTTVTIALAAGGRQVTGRAEPGALLCQPAWEWEGPIDTTSDGAEDAAQREAAADDGVEDGEETDEEVALSDALDGNEAAGVGYAALFAPLLQAAEPPVEGNPVLSDDELERIEDAEYEAMGHEEDPDHKTVTDACPAGTLTPGAWVHEVTVSRSGEAGTEFEELLVVS